MREHQWVATPGGFVCGACRAVQGAIGGACTPIPPPRIMSAAESQAIRDRSKARRDEQAAKEAAEKERKENAARDRVAMFERLSIFVLNLAARPATEEIAADIQDLIDEANRCCYSCDDWRCDRHKE